MHVSTLLSDGGSSSLSLSSRRKQIFQQLRINLNHHPASETVALKPTRDRTDRKLVADFDTDILAGGVLNVAAAKFEINWWTHPVGIDDQFTFHYVESSGYDCGWHRQPHPDECAIPFDHFQQRALPDNDYQYQPVDFQEDTPVGLLWEVTKGRLPRVLRARFDLDLEL